MTQGFASDINGDDTVMGEPEATISIDISQLPARQALAIARAAGLDQQEDYIVGAMVKGSLSSSDRQHVENAEFHIPIEAAITALDELNITSDAPTGKNSNIEVETED